MIDITVPQSAGFPVAWWLMWFAVAFLVYGLLGVWFWRAARCHDRSAANSDKAPT